MPLVSIIIPVIRPSKAARVAEMARKHAGYNDFEIIVEADFKRRGAPKMVKRMTERSNGEFVCFLGDDTLPRKNWLKHAMEAMRKLPDEWGLVGLNDRTGRDLATHWVASKKLLPLIGGEFFCTEYWHCFCDVELTERAAALGRYRYAYKAVVDHDHPILRRRPVTGTYAEIYSEAWKKHDSEVYRKRRGMWANGN